MSRIPRYQEHLKTAFTAEAASAARCRAYAARAERDGRPNLARHWLRLAAEKDRLAVDLLDAAGQLQPLDADLGQARREQRPVLGVLEGLGLRPQHFNRKLI